MSDLAIYAWLVLAFALLVTAHVAIIAGLARRERPRSRALLALIVVPLAPYWGARDRMFARVIAWCLGAVAYVAAWIAAR
jgi:hypothetical protein